MAIYPVDSVVQPLNNRALEYKNTSGVYICDMLRDMPLFVKPVFTDPRMLESVCLPPLKS